MFSLNQQRKNLWKKMRIEQDRVAKFLVGNYSQLMDLKDQKSEVGTKK